MLLKDKNLKMENKERVSVFISANMTESEKLKPIVIGKAKEPRCFRGKHSLPMIYRNNAALWITSAIFKEYLNNLNKRMIEGERKISLIINNCSSHPSMCLSNVKLVFNHRIQHHVFSQWVWE